MRQLKQTTRAMALPSRPLLALAYMSGAVVSFTLLAVAARELAPHHDTFEIMMYRSFLGIGIVVGIGWMAGTLHQIQTSRLGLHALRNAIHFGGQNLWFFALASIPLAQVIALEFTAPIWVALLAPLVIGERWRWVRIAAAAIGFAGILVVTKPGSVEISPGVIAAILSAVCFAGVTLTTKVLSRNETVTSILFWLVVSQAAMGVVAACYDGAVRPPTLQSIPLLVLVGFCGLFSHWCIANALTVAPASVVSPMEFARLPLTAAVGALLYAEAIDPAVAIGAILVLIANTINIRAEREAAPRSRARV